MPKYANEQRYTFKDMEDYLALLDHNSYKIIKKYVFKIYA